ASRAQQLRRARRTAHVQRRLRQRQALRGRAEAGEGVSCRAQRGDEGDQGRSACGGRTVGEGRQIEAAGGAGGKDHPRSGEPVDHDAAADDGVRRLHGAREDGSGETGELEGHVHRRRPQSAGKLRLDVTADTNAPLLTVNGVTLQYKTPRHLVTATYRVDFSVYQSDRYVILGPSGCGKSTLLKAVGGFMKPVEGSIRIRGKEIAAPGPDRMMVFQEFEQLMPWKTVLQNVLFPMKVTRKFSTREATERAHAAIEKVKLGPFRDVYPHML